MNRLLLAVLVASPGLCFAIDRSLTACCDEFHEALYDVNDLDPNEKPVVAHNSTDRRTFIFRPKSPQVEILASPTEKWIDEMKKRTKDAEVLKDLERIKAPHLREGVLIREDNQRLSVLEKNPFAIYLYTFYPSKKVMFLAVHQFDEGAMRSGWAKCAFSNTGERNE